MPLLHFWAAFLPPVQGWLAVGLTLACIAVLGPPVERTKRWWQRTLHMVSIRLVPLGI